MKSRPAPIFDRGFPRAAPRYFPYPGHRNMREVLDDELENERIGRDWNAYYANLKVAG